MNHHKLAFESLEADKKARRLDRSEHLSFHAANSIVDWLDAYSKRIDCPTAAVIRASLIYLATATDPAIGRAMLDEQINQPSLTQREVLLLAAVRLISKTK